MRAFLQVYNLFDYYFCEFQQHICMSLVALLFIETLTSIFNLGNFEFTHQRYRQVIIDIVIDLCCLVLPSLATITRDFTFRKFIAAPGVHFQLGYQIILLPSIWLGFKLRSLLRENMRIAVKKLSASGRKKRRRSTTVRIQIDTMPLLAKRLFILSHIVFGTIFAVLIFLYMFAEPNNCEDRLTKEIWVRII